MELLWNAMELAFTLVRAVQQKTSFNILHPPWANRVIPLALSAMEGGERFCIANIFWKKRRVRNGWKL